MGILQVCLFSPFFVFFFYLGFLDLALREDDYCWLSSRTNSRPSSALVRLLPVFSLTIIGLRFYLWPSSFLSQYLFIFISFLFFYFIFYIIFYLKKNLIGPLYVEIHENLH
ncbi:expressed protein [Phakopsora pachyrhizi]|uniref:Expressed protein n=1 Tax=Phakopsora pachyrhizi TaxID=170000 RepID=A0AAV0ATC6_PHAPC|nr:expressed protein [Phakopsora pachyrhizi]